MLKRLFEITYLLAERGGATAQELAERFGVSRRTIYRDVDALSLAGIPVYAEKGRGGGIRLLPGFVLDRSVFSAEERRQLVADLGGLAALGAPDIEATLTKLAALFGREDAWLEVDFAPWAGGEETREMFRLLRGAILRRQVVEFHYLGASGQESRREVEPWRILFRGQGWYLNGYARERGAYRMFKLTRIQRLAVLPERFVPRPPPAPPEAVPLTPLVEISMRFAPEAAFRVLDEFSPAQAKKLPDGGFLVRTSMPAGDWLTGYLLSFGPSMEVLQPPWAREALRAALAKMTMNYGKNEAEDDNDFLLP